MSAYEVSADPTQDDGSRPDADAVLTLAGVSPDGARLLLTDGDGGAFTLAVDARLHAALRQTEPRQSPEPRMEKQMDSVLRPRDIQARIRAGQSAEQVADAARTTVERVMPYAGPVLAEREHVAERAQKSSLRRATSSSAGESGARTLGDAVEAHLRGLGLDPTGLVTWDAWRREDGRWSVAGRFSVQGRDGEARLTFDPPGNFVVLDDDDARWLVGDLPDEVDEPVAAGPTSGGRRLSAVRERADAVHDGQLSIDDELGLDALDLANSLGTGDSPVEAFLDDQPGLDESELVDQAADAAALDRDQDRDQEPPSRRPIRKTRGRASVPSWDEIMFGGGKPE